MDIPKAIPQQIDWPAVMRSLEGLNEAVRLIQKNKGSVPREVVEKLVSRRAVSLK